ncbi:type IV toxin-antitoxin system AbiEi family antitoxin domain-containing protein [Treponema phagedenis]|uniref:Uncharacterized protein n=1 Tax=Treponema phagedenis TaxID=162 RepID=A0A0B7H384_TREPH|nr:hypothetical protein [Treponema phagedenis]NVP22900.1 hypothetical protein [Treponema phagedenis]QEJ94971.1 hypothetical protein FUT79_06945 [Treponema phagedenis]QEK00874.1 hypothetical protein FUT84_06620 [Treponema phagedenis]QEK05882.1 hypothetical protein FUT80_03525 [Treponema phagedenis]QKS92250.1 hypothetical protein HPJ96_06550 [Treponema phagedenis]
MIKTTAMLLEELSDYASPKTKLSRMVQKGECFQITKGLYETDRNVSAHLLAGSIYGPSYISFEFALSYYGLIPEAVYTVTCATFEKKKKKKYNTPFGTFTYRDVPSATFPLFIELRQEGDYWYRIASPEKALCDELYTMRSVKNTKELSGLLFDDLRIEESELRNLNKKTIAELQDKYRATNIKKLCTLLRRL